MITFKEDSFVIEIPTPGNPIEGYLELQKELLELMSTISDDLAFKPWYTLDLLKNMLADWDTAMKMYYTKDVDTKKLKELFLKGKAC